MFCIRFCLALRSLPVPDVNKKSFQILTHRLGDEGNGAIWSSSQRVWGREVRESSTTEGCWKGGDRNGEKGGKLSREEGKTQGEGGSWLFSPAFSSCGSEGLNEALPCRRSGVCGAYCPSNFGSLFLLYLSKSFSVLLNFVCQKGTCMLRLKWRPLVVLGSQAKIWKCFSQIATDLGEN